MTWRKTKLYREEKCDVTKIQISEIMGLVRMFKKNKSDEKSPLAKNRAVSVRLKLAWIVTFTIQAYFRMIYVESKKSIQNTDWRN